MSTIAHRVEVAPHNKKLKSLLQGPGFRPLFSPCFYCFFCTVLSNKSQNVKNKKNPTSFNLFCTHLSDNHQLLGGRYILTHFLIFFCHRMEESLCLSALRSQFYSVPAGGAFPPLHPSALHLHLPGGRYPADLNHTALSER